MKRIFSAAMACVMALGVVCSAAACDRGNEEPAGNTDVKGTLSAPEGLGIASNGTIYWTAVEHATSYVVSVNETENTVTQTSYQVSAETLKEDFTYSVYAKAAGYADSEKATKTFVAPDVQVQIDAGTSEIRSGRTLTLKATVLGASDTSVKWSVEEGSEYVSIDEKGVVTAKEVTGNHRVRIRATSNARPSRYAEREYTVVAKTDLTQEMLDELDVAKMETSGSLTIEVYSNGTFQHLEETAVRMIHTVFNGESWYSDYDDAAGAKQRIYYKNHENYAQQVGLSLMNDEEYFPMEDESGNPVLWADSGLYNCFRGLSVDDFEFDEETWLWKYVGDDETLIPRMIAMANPYEFTPRNLYLTIDSGFIIGFEADSETDYRVVPGYRSEMHMSVVVSTDEDIVVPTIGKYQRDQEWHPQLEAAIEKTKALESYKMNFLHLQSTMGSGFSQFGYEETITPEECRFRDFTYTFATDSEEPTLTFNGEPYGFKQVSDTLYNTYRCDDGKYTAIRAAQGSIDEVKPQFGFAAEIFRSYNNETPGEITFYAAPEMTAVATQFYHGTTNNDDLYGLYAAEGNNGQSYLPYVTVDTESGYIKEVGFFYNMILMQGVIEIDLFDFNEAEITEEATFTTRQIPTTWGELLATDDKGDNNNENDEDIPCDTFIENYFGKDFEIPFFGEVLGDSYGFAYTSPVSYRPNGGNRYAKTMIFYYDVPLDRNYSIEESMADVSQWLKAQGFVENMYGEHIKGNVGVLLVDSNLDFLIYVWEVSTAQPEETPPTE